MQHDSAVSFRKYLDRWCTQRAQKRLLCEKAMALSPVQQQHPFLREKAQAVSSLRSLRRESSLGSCLTAMKACHGSSQQESKDPNSLFTHSPKIALIRLSRQGMRAYQRATTAKRSKPAFVWRSVKSSLISMISKRPMLQHIPQVYFRQNAPRACRDGNRVTMMF